VGDQHRRGGAGDAFDIVMFGKPETFVTQAFAELRELFRMRISLGDRAAFGNFSEI
jgi:hypothetical protein